MNKLHNNHLESTFINILSRYSYVRWFIFILSVLIYSNSVPNKWAIDDIVVVHGNKFVKRGVSGIDSLLTQETFYGFFENNINAVSGGRWRPLTLALFAVEAELFASVKKDNQENIQKDKEGFVIKDLGADTVFPNILHFINMLLYGVLSLVLYNLLLLVFNPQKDAGFEKGNFIALVSTLLFVAHPLHTEVVDNIKSCDEIMTLLGSLFAVHSLLKAWYASKNNDKNGYIKWWAIGCFSYFLALLAKESAIPFLVVAPLFFWFFTKANLKEITVLVSPLVVVFALFFAMRVVVLGGSTFGSFNSRELMNNPFLTLNSQSQFAPLIEGSAIKKLVNYNVDTYTSMPYTNELATNIYTWGMYLKLLIVPYPLTTDYYPRHIAVKEFTDPFVLLSLIIHIGLLIWAVSRIKKRHIVAFGILYYFATFSIVSNLFFPIGTNMSERFMFMPSVGICVIYGYLMYVLSQKLGLNNVLIGLCVLLGSYSWITINRNFDWKNDYTLSAKDVETSPNSAKIKVTFASEIIRKTMRDMESTALQITPLSIDEQKARIKTVVKSRDSMLLTTIPMLKQALDIHPIFNSAWVQLGSVYSLLAKNKENSPNQTFTYLLTTIEAFKQADFYKGIGMSKAINADLANAYLDLGKFYGETLNDIDKAVFYLEKSKEINPQNADVYFLLGTAYSMRKDYPNMLKNTEKSYEIHPNDQTKENLAVAYQIVAAGNNNKELMLKAEKMLLEVYESIKNLPENTLEKKNMMVRILDLLQKNYTLQGNTSKVVLYKNELIQYQKQ